MPFKKEIGTLFLSSLIGHLLSTPASASFTVIPSNVSTTYRVGINTHFRIGYRVTNLGPNTITHLFAIPPTNVQSSIFPLSSCLQVNSSTVAALTAGETCQILLDVIAPAAPKTLSLSPLTVCVDSSNCVTSSPGLTLKVLGSPNYWAFATSSTSNTVTVIDAINDTVVTTLGGITGANYLAVSHNGQNLYVAQSNSFVRPIALTDTGPVVGSPISLSGAGLGVAFHPDDVSVFVGGGTKINVFSFTGAATVTLSPTNAPAKVGMDISYDGSMLGFAATNAYEYWTATSTSGPPSYTFQGATTGFAENNQLDFKFSPISNLAYGSDTNNHLLYFNWQTSNLGNRLIAINSGVPENIAVSPDGQTLWVTNTLAGSSPAGPSLYIVQGLYPQNYSQYIFSFTTGNRGQGAAFSPDGTKGYVALPFLNELLVLTATGFLPLVNSTVTNGTSMTGPQQIAFMP